MHAERICRLAHLSDLHFPLVWRRGWRARWRRLAAALRAEAPDVVVITGDLVTSGFPAARLEPALRGVDALLAAAVPGAQLVVVPGNHDLKLLGLGPSQGHARAAAERVFGERALVGAHASTVVRGLVHLVGADSNAAAFLAQGRIEGPIELPARCAGSHVHVLLLHHHLHPEPSRSGESAITSSHAGLKLVDAPEARGAIVAAGFNLVLHGHRHLTTAYREAELERFADPVHFVGASSGTDRAWPGFNVVDFFDDLTFRVSAVERNQDAWRPAQTIAVRPYEAVKAGRRALRRREARFAADVADVEVWSDDAGQAEGDVRFRVALAGLDVRERFVPFPARIVPYAGAYLRGVTARWSRGGASSDLQVDEQGRFVLERIPEPSAIEVTGTIANALPVTPGDWVRMQASDPGLAHLVLVRLACVARVLRIRLRIPYAPLVFFPVAEGAGPRRPVDAELAYTLAEHDPERGETRAIVFWPDPDVGYAFSADGAQLGDDDATLAQLARAESEGAADLRRRVESLAGLPDDARVALQVEDALEGLRAELIAFARARSGPLARDEDGLMVNLMSTPTARRPGAGASGLRVVATDEHTAVRAREERVASTGATVPWGAGVVGRALRAQSWAAWSRRGCEGHPMTWRAEEPYHVLPGAPVHEHMLCGPLVHDEAAFAMLSLATYDRNSVLVDALSALTGGGEGAYALFELFEAFQERLVRILVAGEPGSGAVPGGSGPRPPSAPPLESEPER
jgi:3',5'-cyclic AMP phosphodiesterase CpdA